MLKQERNTYADGTYWKRRQRMVYYQYLDRIVRKVGSKAKSMLDVGSGNAPYLDWFDWIPDRVSIDRAPPYESEHVVGIQADFLTHPFDRKFDLVTCLQVLEHVADAKPFAQHLLSIGRIVLISVPYRWPAGQTPGHVQDPVDLEKLNLWFGRPPNWSQIVREPFSGYEKGRRLFALYNTADPEKRYSEERPKETAWQTFGRRLFRLPSSEES